MTFVPCPIGFRRAGPRRKPANAPQVREAIRRGVQYLALQIDAAGLHPSYEPGPGQVTDVIARAAQATVVACRDMALRSQIDPLSPAQGLAIAARLKFARQLAERKAGVARAPATALRATGSRRPSDWRR